MIALAYHIEEPLKFSQCQGMELERLNIAELCTKHMLRVRSHADRHAFVSLFNIMAPKVLSMIMKAGLDKATAEDIVQEVMLKVWHRRDQFEPTKASVATWIYAIARNTRIDHQRKLSKPALSPDEPALRPSEPASQDELLDVKNQTVFLQKAIAELTLPQREVLKLAYLAGLSHSQISKQLNIPEGTVKSRLRLAMDKLRVSMKELE